MSGSNCGPTLAGFLTFIRNVMGIPPQVLPDNAPIIPDVYDVAMDIVNPAMCIAAPTIYRLAVYNLAGDALINYAPDQPQRDEFAKMRAEYNITGFIPGVLSASSDVGTSAGLVTPEFMKTLTMQNLQQLKTYYGRTYLGFAQSFGGWIGVA